MLLEGQRLLITGVLDPRSIAFFVARVAQEQGAEIVLTGFGRGLRLTNRAAARLPTLPDVLELDVTDETQRTSVAEELQSRWLPGLAWVAELDGQVVGWTAVTAVSARECYAGVGESSVYVTEAARGRGVGKALLSTQVTEADRAGMWTLQTSVFPENRASLALHHSAGFRTLAVRTRIAQLDGAWRDTVLLERRSKVT